ncbi:MAG: TetR/AcrR family transcriptional regulator [Spirochaetales bacterium]|nr:MAG: TetR/AcrR family transcriptional regulator [Spirochaetales bacterium]
MKQVINEFESKRRILDAAADIFADKGFDGARVDEIAKAAHVNKALIYYYFKSKEELLEVLCHHTMEDLLGFMTAETIKSLDFKEPQHLKNFLEEYLDALEEHENVIRIMLMESLKRSSDNSMIFSLIQETLSRMFATGREAGLTIGQQSQVEVMEFFTGIMPLLTYVVYHNLWMQRFNLTEPELRDRFLSSFIGTHIAYSAKIYQPQKNSDGWLISE